MSLKRHVLQVVALVTAVALVFGAFAGTASAKKMSKAKKAKVRAELRKQVKRNPGVVKRKSFLKRAALVNFKLPVTIRLRNPCNPSQNPTGSASPGGALLTTENCAAQGTALNQRTIPSANVNLGPSLGTRSVAIGGALAAVVEFQDTYDGGALGNVNLKILPGDKTLTTSSVPLLWNNDITKPGTRSDANFAKANFRAGSPLYYKIADKYDGIEDNTWTAGGLFAAGAVDAGFAAPAEQGCANYTSTTIGSGTIGGGPAQYAPQTAAFNAPVGYSALFYNAPLDLGFGVGAGLPGYTVYSMGGSPNGVHLPIHTGVDDPNNIKAGGVVGNNDWIGSNPNPFPTGSAPTTGSGLQNNPTTGGAPASYGNAADTVLRTNALSLGIAPGGISVNMSTGTQVGATSGGLTSAQGSQDVTLGYSGGQANLFGNIPGKNVGIDVTVNLATKINSIVRIMDQDIFKTPGLIEGEDFPAGIFNCRQIVTGAVQNYIPGVRLTGQLRIAPAITKDGKVRIAKATVASDVNNPDRVALSACLIPAKPYNAYLAGSTDTAAKKIPTAGGVPAGGLFYGSGPPAGIIPASTNGALPSNSDAERYPNLAEGNAPSTVRCNSDTTPELADIIRRSGLTGTVAGLPTPNDPAYAGVTYNGSQASVAGDITVNPIDVDVLLGDQPVGT